MNEYTDDNERNQVWIMVNDRIRNSFKLEASCQHGRFPIFGQEKEERLGNLTSQGVKQTLRMGDPDNPHDERKYSSMHRV
jgi:hypothetical protein